MIVSKAVALHLVSEPISSVKVDPLKFAEAPDSFDAQVCVCVCVLCLLVACVCVVFPCGVCGVFACGVCGVCVRSLPPAGCVLVPPHSLTHSIPAQVIALDGDGHQLITAARPLLVSQPHIQAHLNQFITPKLPERPRFKCMRNGGPPSESNPDPKC